MGKVHEYATLISISNSLRLILSIKISLDFLSTTHNDTTSANSIMSQEQRETTQQLLEIQY